MWALEVAVRLFMGTLHLGDRIPGFQRPRIDLGRCWAGDVVVAIVALQGLFGLASGTIGKCPKFQFGSKSTEAQRRPVKIHEIDQNQQDYKVHSVCPLFGCLELAETRQPSDKKTQNGCWIGCSQLAFWPHLPTMLLALASSSVQVCLQHQGADCSEPEKRLHNQTYINPQTWKTTKICDEFMWVPKVPSFGKDGKTQLMKNVSFRNMYSIWLGCSQGTSMSTTKPEMLCFFKLEDSFFPHVYRYVQHIYIYIYTLITHTHPNTSEPTLGHFRIL